jgi:hypothetical protein
MPANFRDRPAALVDKFLKVQMAPSSNRDDFDEEFEADRVTDLMAGAGAVVLSRYVEGGLGPTQTMVAARRIFCAMRAAEARQREREQKRGG